MVRRIFIGIISTLLITAGLSRCRPNTSQPTWLTEGNRHAHAGEYTAAEATYRRAMTQEPENATPALRLAELYGEWNRPEPGLETLEEAVRRGAVDELVIPLRLQLLTQAQAWETLRELAQTHTSDPTYDGAAARALTLAALHLGDCTAASEAAALWLRATPQSSDAALHRAILSGHYDRVATAESGLNQAILECGLEREACVSHVLIRSERWALALCPLRRAVSANPDNGVLHAWLGEALSRQRLDAEARQHLITGVELAREHPLPWLLLGKHHLARGANDAARSALLNAQALDPGNPAPCLAIAELKAQIGAYDEIEIWANAALERAPNDADVWISIARLYLERHITREPYPIRAATGAVQLAPNEGAAHMVLGWAHLQSENIPEATEALSRALELEPNSGEAHYWLAQALRSSEKTEQAQQMLTRAADLGYFRE